MPNELYSVKEKTVMGIVWKKCMAMLDVIDGNGDEEKVMELQGDLLKHITPKEFGGSDGVESEVKNDFAMTSLILSQQYGLDATRMNSIEYLLAVQKLKKDAKSYKQQGVHTKRGRR